MPACSRSEDFNLPPSCTSETNVLTNVFTSDSAASRMSCDRSLRDRWPPPPKTFSSSLAAAASTFSGSFLGTGAVGCKNRAHLRHPDQKLTYAHHPELARLSPKFYITPVSLIPGDPSQCYPKHASSAAFLTFRMEACCILVSKLPVGRLITTLSHTHTHTLRKHTILRSFEGPVSLAERLQRHVASFGRLQGRLHLLILGELEILVQLLKPFLHGQQEVNDVLNHFGCSLQHMTTSRDETLLFMISYAPEHWARADVNPVTLRDLGFRYRTSWWQLR